MGKTGGFHSPLELPISLATKSRPKPHRSYAVKITTIEVIPLRIPYEARIRKAFYHFGMNEEVTVYKFHTDTGLVGLGENPGPPFEQSLLDAYLGTNPFDHVMGLSLIHI